MGETVLERWVIIWFPPDVSKRERIFKDEGEARTFAETDDVIRWSPTLVHRKTTTVVEERIVVPIFTPDDREEDR